MNTPSFFSRAGITGAIGMITSARILATSVSSHGLFVKGAAELLDQAPIKEILVTDSVATKEQKPQNVKYITASELIGDALVRIQERKPVSPLFAYHKK